MAEYHLNGISDGLMKRVRVAAAEDGISIKEFILQAILDYLSRRRP